MVLKLHCNTRYSIIKAVVQHMTGDHRGWGRSLRAQISSTAFSTQRPSRPFGIRAAQGILAVLGVAGIASCAPPDWAGGGDQPNTPGQGATALEAEPKALPSILNSSQSSRRYSRQALEYFETIAFGSEFSQNRQTLQVRKWVQNLRVAVRGQPTRRDRETLRRIVAELNTLIAQDGINISLTDTSPNVSIYFIPHGEFGRYEPNYVPGNLGFFFGWWNWRMELTQSRILISSDRITQPERNHLIREELTQALGLMNDAWTYENSTFYQGWTRTQNFADIDRELVRILYDPRVKPGQTPDQVRRALR